MEGRSVIARWALVSLVGFIASGPVGFVFVSITAPQPAWVSPSEFVKHYSIIQDIPYYFGFLLVGGMVAVAAAHYMVYSQDPRFRTRILLSVVATTIFAALIVFNYICQTTFVRHLVLDHKSEYDAVISAFSMFNPHSLCWAIEMWGYGILGVGTWLMAECYADDNPWLQRLLTLNGVISILSAAATVVSIDWVMTGAGITGYMIWNLLMIIILVMMIRYQGRLSAPGPA